MYTTPGGCHTQAFTSDNPQVTCICNTDLCNMVTSPVFGGPLAFAELPQIPSRPERPAYGMVGYSDVPKRPTSQSRPEPQPQPQQPQPQPQQSRPQPQPQQSRPQQKPDTIVVSTNGDRAQLEVQNMTIVLVIFSSIFMIFFK